MNPIHLMQTWELEQRIKALCSAIEAAGPAMLGQLSKELTECREELARKTRAAA